MSNERLSQDQSKTETDIIKGQLSQRGLANITSVMPHIPKTILDAGYIPDEDFVIDLSIAENWLVHDEVLEIHKTAMEMLRVQVSYPL